MSVSTQIVKAENLPVDVFIYLPEENRYFFIDDIDQTEDYVLIISEILTDSGIKPDILEVDFDKEFYVVNQYSVNEKNLFK